MRVREVERSSTGECGCYNDSGGGGSIMGEGWPMSQLVNTPIPGDSPGIGVLPRMVYNLSEI